MNQKLKRIRTKDIDKILCLIHYVDLENELRSRFTFQLFAGNCVDDMNMQALWVLLMCFLEAYMYKLLYIVQRATESLQYNSESTKRNQSNAKINIRGNNRFFTPRQHKFQSMCIKFFFAQENKIKPSC